MAQPRLKMRLGDLLVQEQIISDDQLQLALQQQRQTGRKLGTTLIDLGFISEMQLLQFLARQLDVPFFDLNNLTIDAAAVALLPEVQARRYRALAVNLRDDRVTVAMSDPADLSAMDAIAALLSPREMVLAVAREGQLLEYFDRLYRRTREIESFAEQLQEEYQDTGFELGASNLGAADEGEATVAKLLRSLFEDAVQVGASDIHIEPDEKVLRIRQRIDGILHENILNEVRIAQALVLRLKLVAGLDISEKRLPQDGRFNMKVRGRDVDVRISTMPVQYGESVVMRLLDQSSGILSLTETGMPPEILTRFRRQLKRPHGMILVTGPTGSGKTTTLYGALSELNQASQKIITVEDPVEYRLPRISQVQVNPKIGLTFSHVLRSTLRQDPDILLVGEMRDNETDRAARRHHGSPGADHVAHQRCGHQCLAPHRHGSARLSGGERAAGRGGPAPGAAGVRTLRRGEGAGRGAGHLAYRALRRSAWPAPLSQGARLPELQFHRLFRPDRGLRAAGAGSAHDGCPAPQRCGRICQSCPRTRTLSAAGPDRARLCPQGDHLGG